MVVIRSAAMPLMLVLLMKRYSAILSTAQLCIALCLAACASTPPAAQGLSVTPASETQSQTADSSKEIYTEEWLKEIDTLGPNGKRQIAIWIRCQKKFAFTLSRNTSESPESIILAVFEACGRKEDHIRANLKKLESLDRADRFMDRLRQVSRERLTFEIIAGRNSSNQVRARNR